MKNINKDVPTIITGGPVQKEEPDSFNGYQVSKTYIKEEEDLFNFSEITKDLWRDKISEAQKTFNITFDLENNDPSKQRRIIKIKKGDDENNFGCSLWKAGGDWENPVLYFKCQLIKGYLKYPGFKDHKVPFTHAFAEPWFVVIPPKVAGNYNLTEGKKGGFVPYGNGTEHEQIKEDENLLWQYLTEYLKAMVELYDTLKEYSRNVYNESKGIGYEDADLQALNKYMEGFKTKSNCVTAKDITGLPSGWKGESSGCLDIPIDYKGLEEAMWKVKMAEAQKVSGTKYQIPEKTNFSGQRGITSFCYKESIPEDAKFFESVDSPNPPEYNMISEKLSGIFPVFVKNGELIWNKTRKIRTSFDTFNSRINGGQEKEIPLDQLLKGKGWDFDYEDPCYWQFGCSLFKDNIGEGVLYYFQCQIHENKIDIPGTLCVDAKKDSWFVILCPLSTKDEESAWSYCDSYIGQLVRTHYSSLMSTSISTSSLKINRVPNVEKVEAKSHNYACLMVDVDEELKEWIRKISKDIPKEILCEEEGGVEKEIHITLFFGLLPSASVEDIKKSLDIPGIEMSNEGRIAYFDQPTHTVAIIPVHSTQLVWANYRVRNITPNENKRPYQPHITIAYLKRKERLSLTDVPVYNWSVKELFLKNKEEKTKTIKLGNRT